MTEDQAKAVVGVFVAELSKWAGSVKFSPYVELAESGEYVVLDGTFDPKALAEIIMTAARALPLAPTQ